MDTKQTFEKTKQYIFGIKDTDTSGRKKTIPRQFSQRLRKFEDFQTKEKNFP